MTSKTIYRSTDFFMLRRPALPFNALSPTSQPEIDADTLVGSFSEGAAAKALATASEDLYGIVKSHRADPSHPVSKDATLALGRYLARTATRSTPFGACSGVTLGQFVSGDPRASAGDLLRSHVRPDAGWLLQLAKQVEASESGREDQPLRVNDLLSIEGSTAILPGLDVHGEGDSRQARLQVTEVLEQVLIEGRRGKTFEDIVTALEARYPETPRDRIRSTLQELCDINLILGPARLSVTENSPGKALIDNLQNAYPSSSELAGLAEALRLTDALADEADAQRFIESYERTHELQRRTLPDYSGPTLQVDSLIQGETPLLPREVGRAASEIASIFLRLQGAHEDIQPHLTRYRRLFETHYGVDVHVPVKEVLSPRVGIDAPETYTEPARQSSMSDPYYPRREENTPALRAICEFAASALHHRSREIELTDDWLNRIAPISLRRTPFPAVDVFLEISADSQEALAAGSWRAIARPHGVAFGGRTFGRFAYLDPSTWLPRLQELAEHEAASRPDAVFAELTYLPKFGRGGNVATRPLLHRYEIPVNVEPSSHALVLSLDDITLASNGDRFYLWHSKFDRELLVTQNHMLTLDGAPNVCRLLLEVSQQGFDTPQGFDWGPMSEAPRLPRVVRGNAVLRTAQWNIPKSILEGKKSDQERLRALNLWLEEHEVDSDVYLVDMDNRIPLSLTSEFGAANILRALVRARRSVIVEEQLPGKQSQWLTDSAGQPFSAELVVPVVTHPGKNRPAAFEGPVESNRHRQPGERFAPGSAWTYVKLFLPSDDQDKFVAQRLGPFAAQMTGAGLLRNWHYIRYADPEPDLRVRFQAQPGVESDVLLMVLSWGRELMANRALRNLSIDSYVRESTRYGGPEAIGHIEQIFCASSETSARLLAAKTQGQLAGHDYVAIVAACDALFNSWGLSTEDKLRVIPQNREKESARTVWRAERVRLLALLDKPTDNTELSAEIELLQGHLQPQHAKIQEVATRIRELDAADALTTDMVRLLQSLVHMQVNRLVLSGGQEERDCYAIWRRALLAVVGRKKMNLESEVVS